MIDKLCISRQLRHDSRCIEVCLQDGRLRIFRHRIDRSIAGISVWCFVDIDHAGKHHFRVDMQRLAAWPCVMLDRYPYTLGRLKSADIAATNGRLKVPVVKLILWPHTCRVTAKRWRRETSRGSFYKSYHLINKLVTHLTTNIGHAFPWKIKGISRYVSKILGNFTGSTISQENYIKRRAGKLNKLRNNFLCFICSAKSYNEYFSDDKALITEHTCRKALKPQNPDSILVPWL